MANVVMFGLLFLGTVVCQVRAQVSTASSSLNSNTVAPSVIPQPSAGGSTGAPISATTSAPIRATTAAPIGPTTAAPIGPTTTAPISATTAVVTRSSQSTPTSPRTTQGTKKPCFVPSRSFNESKFNPHDGKLVYENSSYRILDTSCTNLDRCCDKKGQTNMTLTLKDCGKTVVLDISCVDLAEPCKCRAGFLNASFFVTLMGMLLYLAPSN